MAESVAVEETTISQTTTVSQSNNIGCVKWFNNKSGYGFITVMTNGNLHAKDIFVHHSSINAKEDLYKYLVQGEYVEFDVEPMKSESHEHQATNVRGILSGSLMCETRHKNKDISKSRDGFTQIRKKSTKTKD